MDAACKNGHLEMFKWLWNQVVLGKDKKVLNYYHQ